MDEREKLHRKVNSQLMTQQRPKPLPDLINHEQAMISINKTYDAATLYMDTHREKLGL